MLCTPSMIAAFLAGHPCIARNTYGGSDYHSMSSELNMFVRGASKTVEKRTGPTSIVTLGTSEDRLSEENLTPEGEVLSFHTSPVEIYRPRK